MISKGQHLSRKNYWVFDNKNQATHQQTIHPIHHSIIHSADDSDQSRFNVEMRVEV
jgi:hypothetical protein